MTQNYGSHEDSRVAEDETKPLKPLFASEERLFCFERKQWQLLGAFAEKEFPGSGSQRAFRRRNKNGDFWSSSIFY